MRNLTLLTLAVFFLTTCSVLDKEEDLPSFIKVESITLNTNVSTEGSAETDLQEIQVTANGQNIGIFALPAVVPILETGSVNLIITPIIKRDGVGTSRVPYPLYTSYRITENLEELDTIEIIPSVSYLDNLTFWIEDFTTSSEFESNQNDSQGELVRTLSEPFGPPASGFIDLPSDGFFFYAETEENFNPPLGRPVFLEMHYSANHPFRVGAVAKVGITESSFDLVGINPTTSSEEKVWKKIYINLTEFRTDNSNSNDLEVYFRLSRDTSFGDPLVFIDNVKVVYQN